MNAFKVHDQYKDNSVDILHVDISNDGDTVRRIMKLWNSKIVDGGLIMFEGGSLERDEIEWMKKYNKESLREEFLMNQIIRDYYTYETYVAFQMCIRDRFYRCVHKSSAERPRKEDP